MFKNKIITILLLICFISTLLPCTSFIVSATPTDYWTDGGIRATSFSTSGTNTITITSEAEFGLLSYNVTNNINTYSGYTVTLATNLDLSAHQWVAIGTYQYLFKGTFDGDNKHIIGLYINTTEYFQGLFSYTDTSTVIKNLDISGTITSKAIAGGFVGRNDGTIINCKNYSTIIGVSNIGGIAGENYGTIINCCNYADINAIGGRSSDYGWLSAGGIVGYDVGNGILNCYNSGNITGGFDSDVGSNAYGIGGIVGCGGSSITNCYNVGTLDNSIYIGGICGLIEDGSITNCYWLNGTVLISGYDSGGVITDCYSFAQSGTTCTLTNSATYTAGSTTIAINGNLVTALNAWVSHNGSATYNNWQAATNMSENNGFPAYESLEIYSVDISWGALTYEYKQIWSTEDCVYNYSWESTTDGIDNKVIITNSSNVAINAEFVYTTNATGTGTSGIFKNSSGNAISSMSLPTTTTPIPSDYFIFDPNGTPTLNYTSWNNTSIGSIQITISKEG